MDNDYDLVPVDHDPFANEWAAQPAPHGVPQITIGPPQQPIDPVIMPGNGNRPTVNQAQPLPALPTSPDQKYQMPDESFMDQFRREGYNAYDPTRAAQSGQNLIFGAGRDVAAPIAEGPSITNVAGAAATLPVDPAIFAGVAAKTADLVALKTAREMAASGAPREAIWSKTGWFQGADQKWRFEIPDNTAGFKPGWSKDVEDLSQRFEHPELYSAYPPTADIQLERMEPSDVWGRDAGVRGLYREPVVTDRGDVISPPEIGVNVKMDMADRRSTTLHELQHDIQRREGFAIGGSPDSPEVRAAAQERQDTAKANADKIFNDLSDQRDAYVDAQIAQGRPRKDATTIAGEFWEQNPKLKDQWDDAFTALFHPRSIADYRRNAYRQLAGEVEARNVQTRQNMSPSMRRQIPPWESEDVRGDQIVRFPQDAAERLLGKPGTVGKPDAQLSMTKLQDVDAKPFAVHTNPSPTTAAMLVKNAKNGFARYFVDPQNNLHMWSGDAAFLHTDLMDHLGTDYTWANYGGAGEVKNADDAVTMAKQFGGGRSVSAKPTASAAPPPGVQGSLGFWEHDPTIGMPVLKGDPNFRGSMNPLDNIPFTYKGKSPSEWTPQEFKEVGDKFGVQNLGPESPAKTFKYEDGSKFNIPGGVEGKFTYYDLLKMKADGIDPSRINPGLHTLIQQKLMRTMTPAQPSSAAQTWQGLMFGMTSPNNPLFPNQLSSSILRMRDPQFLDQLASSIPWKAGDKVPDQLRRQVSNKITDMLGINAGEKGGLGSSGTTDYTRIAELAQMWKKDPAWFNKTAGESWQQYVERLTSQVPGLSMKTGSLGGVWQDLANAGISAIDRHMVNEYERQGGALFKDADEKAAFEKRAVARWNSNYPKQKVKTYDQLKQQSGADGFLGGMKLEHVGNALNPKFRTAKGDINPSLPPHLANANFPVEPEKVNKMGAAYGRALDWNAQHAAAQGQELFPSQWQMWDRIRRRLEPHENMFPGLERMPAMSRDQLRGVSAEHAASGHKTYGKVEGDEGQMNLQPTKRRPNPARFGYFAVPPIAAFGALGAQQQR